MKRSIALRACAGAPHCLSVALACFAIVAGPVAQASASLNYSIDFYAVSAGGNTLRGNCFRLSGTAGQAAPGYSSGGAYSVFAGYWQPAPVVKSDEIFFSGFEGCAT